MARRKTEGTELAGLRPVGAAVGADARARAWELHLRGWSFAAIGRELNLYRETVSKYVRETYQTLEMDRREALESSLEEAVARMRLVQAQAWADHDTDDAREAAVLASALGAADKPEGEGAGGVPAVRSDASGARRYPRDDRGDDRAPAVRFTSQRAAYLRVALDCEREIARLRGLYDAALPLDAEAAVVFRIERVEVTATPPAPAVVSVAGDQEDDRE